MKQSPKSTTLLSLATTALLFSVASASASESHSSTVIGVRVK